MVRRAECWDRDAFSLEVANGANLFNPKQLEAADVHTSQENDRITRFNAKDRRRRELAVDVDRAGGQQRIRELAGWLGSYILHVGEAFGFEKLLRHELRRDTEAGPVVQPDSRSL